MVGSSAMIEAALAVAAAHSLVSFATVILAALAGLALVLGFLTPVASGIIAAEGAAILLWLPLADLHLLDSRMALFELVVIAAALSILGPGATSIDARLFGRREVAISETHRPNDL